MLPFRMVAQGPVVRHFVASAALDGLAVKQAIEVLKSLDPGAVVSNHQNRLKVLLSLNVTVEAALLALNSTGVQYSVGTGAHAYAEDLQAPTLLDTGDPTGDASRYQLAKRSWIDQHPEAYQAILDPLNAPIAPNNKAP